MFEWLARKMMPFIRNEFDPILDDFARDIVKLGESGGTQKAKTTVLEKLLGDLIKNFDDHCDTNRSSHVHLAKKLDELKSKPPHKTFEFEKGKSYAIVMEDDLGKPKEDRLKAFFELKAVIDEWARKSGIHVIVMTESAGKIKEVDPIA